MKFSTLLGCILSLFLLSFTIEIDKSSPIKFMLVIKDTSENMGATEKFITDSFRDSGISSRFDYFIQETSENEYPYPVTEIFHGSDKLGTIYGIPNKDFLSQILSSLEDQVLALERIRQSN